MTCPDPARPSSGVSTSQPLLGVVARCEGCELVVEVDVLGASLGARLDDCLDCGSPVYVIAPSDDDVYLAGFGAGWDACASFMAAVVAGEQLDELTPEVAAVLEGGS